MGKMINMITIVIFVDMLFLAFWGGSTSLESIIWNWLVDPVDFNTNLVTVALTSLFSTIAAGALTAVVVALSGAKTDTVLFASFASAVILNIGKDYLFMFQQISQVNTLLATILIIPFLITFSFITIEWLRGKD